METTIVATVSLVWLLGALVSYVAWIVGTVRGNRIVREMAREIRAQHVAAVRARIPHSTYRVLATTGAEMAAYRAAWHARQDALGQIGRTGQPARKAPPSFDTLSAWAEHRMGLRVLSDVAPTVIDGEASAIALAMCAATDTDRDTLATLATEHGITLDTIRPLGSVSETARTELYVPAQREARPMRAPTLDAPRSVAA